MIIIISNTIPPIAPAITGTAPEPVAVAVAVVGGGVVGDDEVDVVVETSDECNEVVVGNTLVTVGKVVSDSDPSVLDTVTVLKNEILTNVTY